MSKPSIRRAIRFCGALLILSTGGLSSASTPAENQDIGTHGVSAVENQSAAPTDSDGWMMILVGLGAAAYVMRRQQRSFESRHSLAI
jgi:hypothetical protein